ncbi:hypothetical protein [Ruminiclostridium josui]|nr:hypothetical protein [Ruminiclostridium josui]
MSILISLPLKFKPYSLLKPILGTFLSTLASGLAFLGVLYIAFYAGANVETIPFSAFIVMILLTAVVNAVIVQILYIPVKLALGRGKDD